jgi:hypothetical protein
MRKTIGSTAPVSCSACSCSASCAGGDRRRLWWALHHRNRTWQVADGSVIAAPKQPYKELPKKSWRQDFRRHRRHQLRGFGRADRPANGREQRGQARRRSLAQCREMSLPLRPPAGDVVSGVGGAGGGLFDTAPRSRSRLDQAHGPIRAS